MQIIIKTKIIFFITFFITQIVILNNLKALEYDLPEKYSVLQSNLDILTFNKDNDKLEESLTIVKVLLDANPEDGIAKIYNGTLLTIKARDTSNIFLKKSYLDEGLKIMDEVDVSLYREEANIYLRLLSVRGFTNAKAPEFSKRAQIAVDDLKRVEKSVFFNKLKSSDKVKIYAALFLAYRNLGSQAESVHYKSKAFSIDTILTNKIINN